MVTMIDTQTLTKIPFFRGLNGEELAALANVTNVRVVPRGEMLFRPGDPRKTFIVVLTGQLHIYSLFNGEVQTLALLEPGAFAVESALVDTNKKHVHYGEVEADSEILEVDGKAFSTLRDSYPAIANTIYGQIILNLTERLHHANNKLVTIYTTGKIASTYDNLDNLSDLLLSTILEIVHAKRALFVLYKPLEGKAVIREAKGYSNNQEMKNLEVLVGNDPILGAIFSTGTDISISEEMFKNDKRLHTEYASKSMLGIPLGNKDKVVGAILLGEKENAKSFSLNNRILLSIIAHQIVSVIGTAEMIEETR